MRLFRSKALYRKKSSWVVLRAIARLHQHDAVKDTRRPLVQISEPKRSVHFSTS